MRTSRGFTLIELMVVVAIIGLLGSMAIPSVTGMMTRARSSEVKMVRNGIRISAHEAVSRNNYVWPINQVTGGQGEFAANPAVSDAQAAEFTGGGPGTIVNFPPPAAWDLTGKREIWRFIDFVPEGLLRGRYWMDGEMAPAIATQIGAATDLDGNGVPAGRIYRHELQPSGQWNEVLDIVLGMGSVPISDGEW